NLTSDKIKAGDELSISGIKSSNNKTSTTKNSSTSEHTVQKGETLWDIAKKYNTTVDALKKLNGFKNNDIQYGKEIKIK
ncbi:MAG: LysM peptidoglycan-binding domain-containing protein, partial [Ignavibacteriales bacterium]|nr:LysM peptidoglycan-binding domain-containing protein [Ignavibacteriales bacterium]